MSLSATPVANGSPANAHHEDFVITDPGQHVARLSSLTKRIFYAPNASNFHVEICDIATPVSGSPRSKWHTFKNSQHFEEHLALPDPHTRIISISSTSSIKPLRITDASAKTLFSRHNIGPEIYEVIFSFGKKPSNSDAGLGAMTVKHRGDGSYDMQYRLSYIEEFGDTGTSTAPIDWTMRQVGVFHRLVPSGSGSLWVFFHAKGETLLHKRIKKAVEEWEEKEDSQSHWQILHTLVLGSYMHNWRWYLGCLNSKFEDIADLVLTSDFIESTESSKTVIQLQDLDNDLLPLTPRLRSAKATIRSLRETIVLFSSEGICSEGFLRGCMGELGRVEGEVVAHLQSVDLLGKRMKKTVKHLSVSLNLQNQAAALYINKNMLQITKDNIDDSATIRVITIITLIYLPVSFATSFLGMNLFVFNNGNSGFSISPRFWIFVVMSVFLTILTVGSWWVYRKKRKLMKKMGLPAGKDLSYFQVFRETGGRAKTEENGEVSEYLEGDV